MYICQCYFYLLGQAGGYSVTNSCYSKGGYCTHYTCDYKGYICDSTTKYSDCPNIKCCLPGKCQYHYIITLYACFIGIHYFDWVTKIDKNFDIIRISIIICNFFNIFLKG